ncbi:MAG: hypothetical protein KAT70_01800 [Thermoplasmata archaeon]|nr:hypothetical protein [Thermoplasmata archaeon]
MKGGEDCDLCPHEPMRPEHQFTWQLIHEMGSGLLFDANLAVNAGLIRLAFEIFDVERWRQRDTFRKLMIYADVYREKSNAKRSE